MRRRRSLSRLAIAAAASLTGVRGWCLPPSPPHSSVLVPCLFSSAREDSLSTSTVHLRGVAVEMPRGASTLRTALLKAGISPHNGRSKLINCRGLGTCGTCAVEVLSGSVAPRERTARELLRLQSVPPHSFREENAQRLRLACQCAADSEELVLIKYSGFWGQDLSTESTEPADDFQTYFGSLEYPFEDGEKEGPENE
ncbi:hypothetical protein TrVE_jg9538 [Triparma verrucosa]|uniref:2Fe-2S ferredoxin-type domain-containing protein n=1 Tax=Triparma verrucosa TaxID=1606542 RepID=A0A9W7C3W4_9STRA|nr:hypothetical protein TrVE_jg9538 [Triparma verrucosa]